MFLLPVCNIRLTPKWNLSQISLLCQWKQEWMWSNCHYFSVQLRSFQCHVCNSNGDPNGCSEADPGPLVGYMTSFSTFVLPYLVGYCYDIVLYSGIGGNLMVWFIFFPQDSLFDKIMIFLFSKIYNFLKNIFLLLLQRCGPDDQGCFIRKDISGSTIFFSALYILNVPIRTSTYLHILLF